MKQHLTTDDLIALKNALDSGQSQELGEILSRLGNPSEDEIVRAALEGMKSDDRNLRVAMLRCLAHYPSLLAKSGIVAGLKDDERRVREVAVTCSKRFLPYTDVTAQLKETAVNANEKRKIRERALSTLVGSGAPVWQGPLPQNAANVVAELLWIEPYHSALLHGLIQLDPSAPVKALLSQIVARGGPEEVAMASKALSGHKMVNLGHFDDEETRRAVKQTEELASGQVFYWIPLESLAEYHKETVRN